MNANEIIKNIEAAQLKELLLRDRAEATVRHLPFVNYPTVLA